MTRTEHILYETVTLVNEREAWRLMTCIRQRKSPHSLSKAPVRRLCMIGTIMSTIALEILEHCTSITSLAIWIESAWANSARLQESVDRLSSLTELSLTMSSMFSSTTPSFATLDIAHRITHLEIRDRWILWTSLVGIEEMTRLTHLALELNLGHSCAQHIQRILHRCSTLEAVLLNEKHCSRSEANAWLETHSIHDIWIVWTEDSTWNHWDIIGLGEEACNIWDYADEIVAWRCQNDGTYQDHIQDEEY